MNPAQTQPIDRLSPRWAGWIAIMALAAALRFGGLTDRELWFDESCTFFAATHFFDWPTDGPDPASELAHRPYYASLSVWTTLMGDSAWALRSYSAICGCIAVLLVGILAGKLGGRRAGLAAALLAAVHPLHIYYSQEARVYALWSVLVAACLLALVHAARTLRPKWWALYAALAWITTLTHYDTLFWLPGTAAVVALAADRRRCVRQWLTAHALLAVALAPIVVWWVLPMTEGGPRLWLRETWLGYPPLLAIPKSLWALLPSGGYPSYLDSLSVAREAVAARWGGAIAWAACWGPALIVGAAALARLVLRNRPASDQTEHTVPSGEPKERGIRGGQFFLLVTVIAFLCAICAYSAIVRPAYIVARYDLAAWPAVTVAVAMLVTKPAGRLSERGVVGTAFRWVLISLLVACSLTTLVGARSIPQHHTTQERASRIAAVVGDDDLLISVAMYRWFMTYEWHRIGFTPQVLSFPACHDRQLCWNDPEAELRDPDRLEADLAHIVDRIRIALAGNRHVWLLAQGDPSGPRWPVDRRLFDGLDEAGIDLRIVDEWVGLIELLPARSSANGTG